MADRLRAVIVGLGQVAWKFDEEPGRISVWTHVGAYKSLADRFEIVGCIDADATARAVFSERHPEIPVAEDISKLPGTGKADVISICTPAPTHHEVLNSVMSLSPHVVWCEKPLATSLSDGKGMVETCRASGAKLLVSHVRRWSPLWLGFKEQITSGEIGTLRSLRVAIPNRLWSMGSHAVDMLLWLGGDVASLEALPVTALEQQGEPAITAVMTFSSGASGVFQVTGLKENLIVEAEAIGDDGRLLLREDTNNISFEPFHESPRYEGYRQLADPKTRHVSEGEEFSPFIAIACEAEQLARGTLERPSCDGEAALAAQALLEQLAEKSGNRGKSGDAAA